jgi:hypothetical protein
MWDPVFEVRGTGSHEAQGRVKPFEVRLCAYPKWLCRNASVVAIECALHELPAQACASERLRRKHAPDRAFGEALVRQQHA